MNEKTIHCPVCNSICGKWDGKSVTNILFRCKLCNKRLVYHIDKDFVECKSIPERNTSSGLTYV